MVKNKLYLLASLMAVVGAVFFVAYSSSASLAAGRERNFRILVTSFEPFGQSNNNNSMPIAAEVLRAGSAIGANVEIVTCNLAVIYDTAAKQALACVDQYHPDIVVSLGEAECSLRIEANAKNLDATNAPDNARQIRKGSPIVPGGSPVLAFGFPNQALYCGLGANASRVQVSADAGAFVCNNTAYHLARELGGRVPFTFIHVPNSQCAAGAKDPAMNASLIVSMLRDAVTFLRSKGGANGYWPHTGNSLSLPASSSESANLVRALRAQGAPSCEVEYASRLLSAHPGL